MTEGYNRAYELLSTGYVGERYIVIKRFDLAGSYLYRVKNAVESRSLASILELVCSDNLQVVVTNSPDVYGEYKPYNVITDLREIISLAMNN